MSSTIVIPTWSQGRTGLGQGGWSCAAFEAAVGEPISVSLRAPIPLETELVVAETDTGWDLRDGETVIMAAVPSTVEYAETEPVSIEAARDARTRFPCTDPAEHAAEACFSCGLQASSMQVHPGPLADGTGRFATDFVPPTSAAGPDGVLPATTIWASLDCVSGFFVGHHPVKRESVTAQYSVEILEPVRAGERHSIVAWDGRWPGEWDGRKRGAASCLFDASGRVLARSDSFWIALD